MTRAPAQRRTDLRRRPRPRRPARGLCPPRRRRRAGARAPPRPGRGPLRAARRRVCRTSDVAFAHGSSSARHAACSPASTGRGQRPRSRQRVRRWSGAGPVWTRPRTLPIGSLRRCRRTSPRRSVVPNSDEDEVIAMPHTWATGWRCPPFLMGHTSGAARSSRCRIPTVRLPTGSAGSTTTTSRCCSRRPARSCMPRDNAQPPCVGRVRPLSRGRPTDLLEDVVAWLLGAAAIVAARSPRRGVDRVHGRAEAARTSRRPRGRLPSRSWRLTRGPTRWRAWHPAAAPSATVTWTAPDGTTGVGTALVPPGPRPDGRPDLGHRDGAVTNPPTSPAYALGAGLASGLGRCRCWTPGSSPVRGAPSEGRRRRSSPVPGTASGHCWSCSGGTCSP